MPPTLTSQDDESIDRRSLDESAKFRSVELVRENLFKGPNEGPTLEVNLVLTADTQVRHVLIHSAVPLLRSKIAPGGGETHIMPVPIGKGFMPMPVQSGGLLSLEGTAKGRMRFTLYDYDGPMPEAPPAAPPAAAPVQARNI